ncbi:hypothetical protein BD410DRAFT_808807 [Rickenella mellea]|uniref:Uncharacterized protein n=1 Tax=Rickenella mellea TaxID=50990 RepID=A0A4Y7PLX5_9AGAM|nr:hypothetical protein BD410DRAFT_808807 [Rickenella mellea]
MEREHVDDIHEDAARDGFRVRGIFSGVVEESAEAAEFGNENEVEGSGHGAQERCIGSGDGGDGGEAEVAVKMKVAVPCDTGRTRSYDSSHDLRWCEDERSRDGGVWMSRRVVGFAKAVVRNTENHERATACIPRSFHSTDHSYVETERIAAFDPSGCWWECELLQQGPVRHKPTRCPVEADVEQTPRLSRRRSWSEVKVKMVWRESDNTDTFHTERSPTDRTTLLTKK